MATPSPSASGYTPPPRGGVNVGGGSSVGRALFALAGGLGGAYFGFYLQSKYIEERRVRIIVEMEARKRWEEEKAAENGSSDSS